MHETYELAAERQRRFRDEAAAWHLARRAGTRARVHAALARATARRQAPNSSPRAARGPMTTPSDGVRSSSMVAG